MPDQAMPQIVNPIDDCGAIDYRNRPSAGNTNDAHPTGDYDHPIGQDWHAVQPWTDNTWEAYDEQTDASRYRGINTPQQQAKLHLSPDPQADAQGWSPDLDQQLAWQRQVSGAPPP